MRIALITEGTYPTTHGGVSVWCDQLIRGLPEYDFDVHAIVASAAETPLWKLPPNIRSMALVPLWDTASGRRPRRSDADSFREPFGALLDAMFAPGAGDTRAFLEAVRALRKPARDGGLSAMLRSAGSVEAVLRRWRDQPLAGRELRQQDRVPTPTVSDASAAVSLLDHFLRPLGAPAPDADLCHTVANGLACLIALNAKWENGVPFLLTEHGIYLRERYLEYRAGDYPFAVRALIMRFFRLLTAAAYLEADFMTPGSEYNRRWQIRHGAPAQRVQTVYNGINPADFPARDEPVEPTLTWLGRITPIKDVESLIIAFGSVAGKIPGARLRLFGSAPTGDDGYLARCLELVDSLGLNDAVSFEGRVDAPADAYHAGNVVVLSSASEGFPYTVIEAMASGRATVSTDVGGVSEAVGDAGLVVPPRDPDALAQACVHLLLDEQLRARMAQDAWLRARSLFTLDQFLGIYRGLYPLVGRKHPGKPDLPSI